MAKVFKATIYITESMGNYDTDDLRDTLEECAERFDLSLHIAEVKESEEFEWDDGLDINVTDAATSDYEKYIK